MNILSIKEDRIIWVGLVVSLFIHGLLFAFSGKTFIQQAQYSVRPSEKMVEVSIVSKDSIENTDALKIATQVSVLRNHIELKQASHGQSGVEMKANPDYFQNLSPEYPELAKQMHQEGIVMLSVDVDKTGDPVNVEIMKSSGYRLLDEAALRAIRHWKFQPGSISHIPVESTVTVPVRFRLALSRE